MSLNIPEKHPKDQIKSEEFNEIVSTINENCDDIDDVSSKVNNSLLYLIYGTYVIPTSDDEFIFEFTDVSQTEYAIGAKNTSLAGNIVIPFIHEGKPVTQFIYEGFSGCVGIQSILIPNTIKSIGQSAFLGCSGISTVRIPASVINFFANAFESCGDVDFIFEGNTVISEIFYGTTPIMFCQYDSYAYLYCREHNYHYYVNYLLPDDGIQEEELSESVQEKLNAISSGLQAIQIDGVDLPVDHGKSNFNCNTAYDEATNKIATMSDIAAAVSSVYRPCGSATVSQLNNPSLLKTEGDVYNLSDSGYLNNNTLSVSIGDNVVWIGNNATGAWDKLAADIDLSNYYTSTQVDNLVNAKYTKPVTGIPKSDLASDVQNAVNDVANKQATLVSGTNIKTINNNSILGSGDLSIPTGITGVKINNSAQTVSDGYININTEGAYNPNTNKIATMADVPSVSGKEDATNKVTSLSAQSTDTQYPSAKCVYDLIGDIESALIALRGELDE